MSNTILHMADVSVIWLILGLWLEFLKLELNKIGLKSKAKGSGFVGGFWFVFFWEFLHVDPFCCCPKVKTNNHPHRP